MTCQNEKSGWGGHPNRTRSQATSNTKRITTDRREIKAFRYDREAEKRRRLKRNAGLRFCDLARLIEYRRQQCLAIGPEVGWAAVLANLVENFGVAADVHSVDEIRRRLRLPEMDPDIVAACCRPADGLLLSAAVAGDLLEISACEHGDTKLRTLDACDEKQADRKRRLARERQRRRRSVTHPYNGKDRMRDTRRRSASPALRAFRSSCSIRLPSRQEPPPSSFPNGKKMVHNDRLARQHAEPISRRDQAGKGDVDETGTIRRKNMATALCARRTGESTSSGMRTRNGVPSSKGWPHHELQRERLPSCDLLETNPKGRNASRGRVLKGAPLPCALGYRDRSKASSINEVSP